MAGPSETDSSKKKPRDGPNIFVHNRWSYSWNFGLSSWKGFVFYLLLETITSLGFVAEDKFSIHSYFGSSNGILFDGFLGGLMSFVLFWTYPSLLSYLILVILPMFPLELHRCGYLDSLLQISDVLQIQNHSL